MTDGNNVLAAVLSVLAGIVVCQPAWGMVEGSPHDLVGQEYIVRGESPMRDNCVFCHLPMTGGEKYPVVGPPPSVEEFSRSGLICYSCHDGTSIVSRNVDASQSSFHPGSHPLKRGETIPAESMPAEQLLPVRDGKLECITCHHPHDSSLRPFMRLAKNELCVYCHKGMENRGYGSGNISGGHPVHETIQDDAGKTTPIEPGPPFLVPFPDRYPINGGRFRSGVHWRKGGHLSAGAEGTLECYTCHAVHGSDRNPPLEKLLVMPLVREKADVFCESCHRGQRGDNRNAVYAPNPGGTTTGRTYHPCDDDTGNGIGWLVDIRADVSWPFGTGSPPEILCTTCHVAHGGMRGSPALRQPELSETFCEECHLPELMLGHHPSGDDGGDLYNCMSPPDYFEIGDNTDGKVYCSSCHVAHNAGLEAEEPEEDFIPILRYPSREDDLCLVCHPEDNVTCREGFEGTASHFMGDPSSPETYGHPEPPLRTDPWPETKLNSKYGGQSQKKIICLSCHVFRTSGVATPETYLPHYLLARAGNEYEWGDDIGIYLCTGCHGDNPVTEGEGHTHPLMDADVQKLTRGPIPPATYTTGGHLNCDSCHRSHGAMTEGGCYILEMVNGQNEDPKAIQPMIEFTPLCHLCHNPDEY